MSGCRETGNGIEGRKGEIEKELYGLVSTFPILITVMVLWAQTYVKTHHVVHLKYMQFTEYQFHTDKAIKILFKNPAVSLDSKSCFQILSKDLTQKDK